MKIVVIGASGLIGSKLVKILRQRGQEVVEASLASGVNIITGEGLDAALDGAEVVVDVSNSPSFEDKAVLEFFETSSRNIIAAEEKAGVRYHVALSVVGSDRLPDSGYLRAKVAQEKLIHASPIPYTILRSTQFFEFLRAIANTATVDQTVRLSPALFQPIASDDVVAALADVVMGPPVIGMVEVGGPERIGMAQMVERYLKEMNDPRTVLADPRVTYFGADISDGSLMAGENARIGSTSFEQWFAKQAQPVA
jgi:uncharacterized protein YbjT (DUF2867 family)